MDKFEPTPKIEHAEDAENVERINAYLESKLPLFSNLKEHLDSISSLKETLISYMSSCAQSNEEDKTRLKRDIKNKLVGTGVYKDEELLEFLLLIAEKERSFEDCPDNDAPDVRLCKYYFDKYKTNENWSPTDFDFYRQHTHSHQTEKSRILEEIAIEMITKSRASLEKAIKPTPEEITKLIKEVDTYFQQSFSSFFGTPPPLSLVDVTQVTEEFTEHADRISCKTFIDIQNYYKNREQFIHYVIHEAMHLCFAGFNQKKVEEGLIEYFIEKMIEKYPPHNFSYTPVSETYQEWKENLESINQALPDAERYFTTFFLTGDIRPLKDFLKSHLSDKVKKTIETSHYSRGILNFIDSLNKLVD
jgi:hypothetical protein